MPAAPLVKFSGSRAVVMDDHGRVLLLKRPDTDDLAPGFWNLPGGAIDPGEKPFGAAVRELREETGLSATYAGFETPYGFPGGRGMAYLFRHPEGELVAPPREVAEVGWFYPSELPALTLPGTVEAVRLLAGHGKAPMAELTLTDTRLRLEAWAGRQMLPWLVSHVEELAADKGLVLRKSRGDDAAGEEAMFRVLLRAMKLGRSEAAAALRTDAARGVQPPGRELSRDDLAMLRTIARRNVRLVKATTERELVAIALQAQAATVQTLITKLYDMTRANLIGADLVSKGYANGVIDVLKANGYRYIFWRTMEDEKVCPVCRPLNNQRMTIKQFLKRAPAHPRCRCWPATHPELELDAAAPQYRATGPRVDYGDTPRPVIGRDPRVDAETPVPIATPTPVTIPANARARRVFAESAPVEPPPPREGRARRERMRKSLKGASPMQTQLAALRVLTGDDVRVPDMLVKAIDPQALAQAASQNAKKRNRNGGKFAPGRITTDEPGAVRRVRTEPAPTKPSPTPESPARRERPEPGQRSPQPASPAASPATPGVTQDAAAAGGEPQSPLAHLPRDTQAPHALIDAGTRMRDHLRTLQPGTDEHRHHLAQYDAVRNAISAHNERSSSTNQVARGRDVQMPSVPGFVQGGEDALRTPRQFMLQLQRAQTREDALSLGHYMEAMERRDGLRGKDWDAAWDAIVAHAGKLGDGERQQAGRQGASASGRGQRPTGGGRGASTGQQGGQDEASATPGPSAPATPTPDPHHDQADAAPATPEERTDHAEVNDWAEQHAASDDAGEETPAPAGPAAEPPADNAPAGGDRPRREPRENPMDRARRKLEGKERESHTRSQRGRGNAQSNAENHAKAKKLAEGLVDTLGQIQAEHRQENLER